LSEYVAIVSNIKDLKDGQTVELFVQDLTPGPRKYNGEVVKAVVYLSPDRLPGGDILWLRSPLGRLYDKPYAMRITRRLGVAVPGRPYES